MNRLVMVDLTCPGCERPFSVSEWAMRDRRAERVLYWRHRRDPSVLCCSLACSMREGEFRNCDFCDVRIYVQACRLRNHGKHFCSRSCNDEWKRDNGSIRSKESELEALFAPIPVVTR